MMLYIVTLNYGLTRLRGSVICVASNSWNALYCVYKRDVFSLNETIMSPLCRMYLITLYMRHDAN